MEKKKTILVLILVLAALTAVYAVVGAQGKRSEEAKEKEVKESQIKITDIEDVTRISYSNDNTTMTFVKDDDTWQLEDDPEFPLDQYTADMIQSQAASLRAVREIKKGDDLADYGLLDPQYILVLIDEQGKNTTLYIGDATGEDYYLMLEEDQSIYTIEASLVNSLVFDRNDLITLETYPYITQDAIRNITVNQGGTDTVYESGNTEQEEIFGTLAEGITSLRVDSCADYSLTEEDMETYGLTETSRTTVTVAYTEDDIEKTWSLYIGKQTEDKASYYVQTKDAKVVNLVKADIVNKLISAK